MKLTEYINILLESPVLDDYGLNFGNHNDVWIKLANEYKKGDKIKIGEFQVSIIKHSEYFKFIFKYGEDIVAYMYAKIEKLENLKVPVINVFMVHPEYRGQGIASDIYKNLIEK